MYWREALRVIDDAPATHGHGGGQWHVSHPATVLVPTSPKPDRRQLAELIEVYRLAAHAAAHAIAAGDAAASRQAMATMGALAPRLDQWCTCKGRRNDPYRAPCPVCDQLDDYP